MVAAFLIFGLVVDNRTVNFNFTCVEVSLEVCLYRRLHPRGTTQGAEDKLAKKEMESAVYSEYDEQFQAVALLVLLALVLDVLIVERKNPLFKNIKLFRK